MRKFSELNESYQILDLDPSELVNELKDIAENINYELKFVQVDYNGSITSGAFEDFLEYEKSHFTRENIDSFDDYLFVPHFYFNFKLKSNNFESDFNLIDINGNINFVEAYSFFPLLDQLSKLRSILEKYDDNFHILLYEGEEGDQSVLRPSGSSLKIELLGRDPFEIGMFLK